MVYIGVLWNTVNHLREEILQDTNNFGKVINYFDCDLGKDYNNFVRKIYQSDGIAEWKVDLKLQAMNITPSTHLTIFFIDIDDSEKELNDRKHKIVSINMERMKNSIRNKYSQMIQNYFFDNVFHMTDDETELANTLEVIKEYFPNIYNEYFEIKEDTNVRIRRKNRKGADKNED